MACPQPTHPTPPNPWGTLVWAGRWSKCWGGKASAPASLFSCGHPTDAPTPPVQAAVEHVLGRADVDPGKLILSGRSLGGAVALYAADRYRHRVKGVVVENTFTSLSDVVGKVFPPLGLLIGKQR